MVKHLAISCFPDVPSGVNESCRLGQRGARAWIKEGLIFIFFLLSSLSSSFSLCQNFLESLWRLQWTTWGRGARAPCPMLATPLTLDLLFSLESPARELFHQSSRLKSALGCTKSSPDHKLTRCQTSLAKLQCKIR